MMNRRRFGVSLAAAAGTLALAAPKLRLGIGCYTYHSLTVDAMIKQLKALKIAEIELSRGEFMTFKHPPVDMFETFRRKIDAAGVKCVSYYAPTIKTQADLDDSVKFAKILGVSNISGDPEGEMLKAVDERLTGEGLTFGIHNHFFPKKQFVYDSPADILKALDGRSKTMGCTLDIGHIISCGHDPLDAIRKLGPYLKLVHLKDIQAPGAEVNVALGTGLCKIPEVMAALKKIWFKGLIAFEYEKEGEINDDVARQIAYARKLASPAARVAIALMFALVLHAAPARKVVLIAGVKSHGPTVHEYLKSVKLLKVLLDTSPNLKGIETEVYFNGWPEDPATLETASTIVVISDGQPSDRLPPMPLLTPDRIKILRRQMARGCGLMSIHYSTFITYDFAAEARDWQGGYYEWKPRTGALSLIKTIEAEVVLPSPQHPIVRGLAPFRLKDEYYYRLRLNSDDSGFAPIMQVPDLPGPAMEQTVAWAIERKDGGRGFATSTGHFFSNWNHDSYRRLILNAIAWTAGMDVPAGGVASTYVDETAVNRRLAKHAGDALIVADDTTGAALQAALESEIPRFRITRTTPGDLPKTKLSRYRLVVVHSENTPSKQLADYVRGGGGLVMAGTAGATPADEKIDLTATTHPITRAIPNFETKADGGGQLAGGEVIASSAAGPVATATVSGKGRVFRTLLGRDGDRIANPGVTQMILYGSIWAAAVDDAARR